MRRTSHHKTSNPRSAYTLLEVLLVLGVLLVLTSIIWPMMHTAFGQYQVQQAAEEMRIRLAATRLRAIDSGLVYQFRYEPGGRRFLAIPFERDNVSGGNEDPESTASNESSKLNIHAGELPERMVFRSTASQPAGERVAEEWLQGLPDATKLAESYWSPPLLFHPDGSATGTSFEVVRFDDRFVRVSVRELTGAVSLQFDYQEMK